MPLQLEFDYRFSRAIKQRLKRQCFTPFESFTSPKSYYPQTSTHYKDLPKLRPPKTHKLSEKQIHEIRKWRAIYSQSVPQKTVRNITPLAKVKQVSDPKKELRPISLTPDLSKIAEDFVVSIYIKPAMEKVAIPNSITNWINTCLSEWGRVPSGVPQGTKSVILLVIMND